MPAKPAKIPLLDPLLKNPNTNIVFIVPFVPLACQVKVTGPLHTLIPLYDISLFFTNAA